MKTVRVYFTETREDSTVPTVDDDAGEGDIQAELVQAYPFDAVRVVDWEVVADD